MQKKLKLSEIVTDAGTQVRAGLNETTVAEYAEALAGGAKFPPVTVFSDGGRYLAADGFHRIHAAIQIEAKTIDCDIRKGTRTDALKFALSCNVHHGLRRTHADKRHAVGMALREFPEAGIAVIADMCLVSNELVSEIKKTQVVDNQRNHAQQVAEIGDLNSSVRIGRDGKKYHLSPPPVRPSIPQAPVRPVADQAEGSTPTAVAAPLPPPPPSQVLDATNWPIPTQLIPLWQRADEVQELLTILSRVKGVLRSAQDKGDMLFAEVCFSSALSQLDQAWTDIKTAKPFAVCPVCQGQVPDQCTLCKGRGMLSEHRWNTCVPREDKMFRAKRKAAGNLPDGNSLKA